MRIKVMYAVLALVIIGIVVGSLVWGATAAPRTKVVTRVVTKTKVPVFDGTLPMLIKFLQPKQGKETVCPAQFRAAGVHCYLMMSQTWLVSAVIAPVGQTG